eukprot:287928_1
MSLNSIIKKKYNKRGRLESHNALAEAALGASYNNAMLGEFYLPSSNYLYNKQQPQLLESGWIIHDNTNNNNNINNINMNKNINQNDLSGLINLVGGGGNGANNNIKPPQNNNNNNNNINNYNAQVESTC